MKQSLQPTILSLISLVFLIGSIGCTTRRDITHTPEIQAMGVIGKGLVLTRDASVFQIGGPFRRLIFEPAPEQPQMGGPGKQVADLPAGTRLRIAKVVYATVYDDGLFQMRRNVALARMESGALEGKLVDLGLAVGIGDDPLTQRKELFSAD